VAVRAEMIRRTRPLVATAACFQCPVRHTAFCNAVADQNLPQLFSLATEHEFKPGAAIVETGAKAEFVDIIRTGSAFIFRILPNQHRAITQVLMPTDIVGLVSVGEHSLTVQAARKTLVCRFRKSAIKKLMADSPEVQHEIRHYLDRVTMILQERIATMGMKNSLQKLIAFITYIWGYQEWPANDNTNFELPLKRQEIADLLGMSPETVSKCFTALRKMQIIDLPRPQQIRILDREKLFALGYATDKLPPEWRILLQNFHKAV
jgi:CRP/FNR family transcriptional regulator